MPSPSGAPQRMKNTLQAGGPDPSPERLLQFVGGLSLLGGIQRLNVRVTNLSRITPNWSRSGEVGPGRQKKEYSSIWFFQGGMCSLIKRELGVSGMELQLCRAFFCILWPVTQ